MNSKTLKELATDDNQRQPTDAEVEAAAKVIYGDPVTWNATRLRVIRDALRAAAKARSENG